MRAIKSYAVEATEKNSIIVITLMRNKGMKTLLYIFKNQKFWKIKSK